MPKFRLFLVCILFLTLKLEAQLIEPGAARLDQYIHLLQHKRVGVFANHTSMIGDAHLVDVLKKNKVDVKVIFGPEHGFRGTADAGEKVSNSVDVKTGIPVISLYGPKRKPSKEDLQDLDVLIFDIQDVGARFYTYISSLQDFMEAVFENQKELIVMDRPNPNIHYVDGPLLDTAFRSFVGMQPIPVVYGMSIGEYAQMLVGEHWISTAAMQAYASMKASGKTPIRIIHCGNYNRSMLYQLPVNPSPNLPNMGSIYWYPSTCFFEGTVLSEGRGTSNPFQIIGHPSLPKNMYSFTPTARSGAMQPKLKDQVCYGWNLTSDDVEKTRNTINGRIQIHYLIEAYTLFPEKDKFFILPASGNSRASFFNKLAGSEQLMSQIKAGLSEEEIRKSWQPGIEKFMKIRSRYLIYP
ncbi:MAG: hypothetical protein RL131_1542 [Bacteroidota bacterium]